MTFSVAPMYACLGLTLGLEKSFSFLKNIKCSNYETQAMDYSSNLGQQRSSSPCSEGLRSVNRASDAVVRLWKRLMLPWELKGQHIFQVDEWNVQELVEHRWSSDFVP